jgi:hypothetical protein
MPENAWAPVDYLQPTPGPFLINLFEIWIIFGLRLLGGPAAFGANDQRKAGEAGRKAAVRDAESVKFLTRRGFSLPKVGIYAKRN